MTSSDPGAPSAADPLNRVLTEPPPALAALPPEQREDLAELIEHALQQRVQDLTTAAMGALDNIPVFLRGAVRKAVGL